MTTFLLAADHISLTYPGAERPALDRVDLHLRPGDRCGLIGPNGAGKTTLLSILTTLLRPDGGSFTICEADGLTAPRKIRHLIGFVPQELAIYSQLTGLENLLYFGRLYGLGEKELHQRVAYYLDMFGLYGKRGQKVATYSGGMKRRINLIVGIMHEPKLLFLDEPTVGIDAQSRHLIIDRLGQLSSRQMAMVYTSHYMEEVEQLCNLIVIIDRGKIVDAGNAKELLTRVRGCSNLTQLYLQKTGEQLRD